MVGGRSRASSGQDDDPRRPTLSSVPGIDASVVAVLAKARVSLVQHLLAWPEADLARNTGLSRSAIRQACAAVHSCYAARGEVASDMRTAAIAKANLLERRVYRPSALQARSVSTLFDARPGDLIEFVGVSGSGKTQLCLSVAAAALACGQGVVLLDTSSGLSIERIASVIKACDGSDDDVNDALQRVLVVPVGTLSKTQEALSALVEDCLSVKALYRPGKRIAGSNSDDEHAAAAAVLSNLGMIVFDSPAAVLAPALGWRWPDGWSGFASSNEVSRSLRSLARITDAVVVMTNRQARSDRKSEYRPALGRSWAHVADGRIFLEEVASSFEQTGVLQTVCRAITKRAGLSEPFLLQVDDLGVSRSCD